MNRTRGIGIGIEKMKRNGKEADREIKRKKGRRMKYGERRTGEAEMGRRQRMRNDGKRKDYGKKWGGEREGEGMGEGA